MPHYELLFSHSFSLDDPLRVGDAFRYGGDVWQVAEVTPAKGDGPRVLLRLWPGGMKYPATIYGESARN